MSTNMDRLKEKMSERNISHEELAQKLGIDVSTLYRKLKSDGMTFTVGQLHIIVDVLGLSDDDAASIFLWSNSHKCE